MKQEKLGVTDLDADTLRPRCRARFEKLDHVFGRDRVHQRPFDPRNVPSDDIVLDFAEAVGVTLPADARVRANDGLSLEASKLIRKMPTLIIWNDQQWTCDYVGGPTFDMLSNPLPMRFWQIVGRGSRSLGGYSWRGWGGDACTR